MVIEIRSYRDKGKELIMEELKRKEKGDLDRQGLCLSLGFGHWQSVVKSDIDPGLFFRELKEYDLIIWRRFLPKRYRLSVEKEWKEYSYDIIPTEVLQEMRFAKNSGLFQDLEIWTTERTNRDPLLVGILGGRRFMISRWGERLLSFDEIMETVEKRALNFYNNTKKYADLAYPFLKNFICEVLSNPRYNRWEEPILLVGKMVIYRHCKERRLRVRAGHYDFPRNEDLGLCLVCGDIKGGYKRGLIYLIGRK